eukprot:CAMPEP_0173215642 /NCGR_PEP_ID=MMETSP1141-20130122/26606_1 /TAXON_ID=483371 /ORGANISM="non described non described, Strain CCMP2298" /LENGTH=75 /DNA_ID=CAMNT_0014143069 /DNA_START=57 /DNA_END=284 /DNA_ORIENTATION=+
MSAFVQSYMIMPGLYCQYFYFFAPKKLNKLLVPLAAAWFAFDLAAAEAEAAALATAPWAAPNSPGAEAEVTAALE